MENLCMKAVNQSIGEPGLPLAGRCILGWRAGERGDRKKGFCLPSPRLRAEQRAGTQ